MARFTGKEPEFPGQCEGARSNGLRCRNRAIKGSNVCAQRHGGSAPQVKAAARLRLAMLVDPAIDVAAKLLKPGRGKYVKPELQWAAAKDVLDRNGFKAKDEIVLTQELDVSRFSHMSDDEIKALVSLARKAVITKEAADADN